MGPCARCEYNSKLKKKVCEKCKDAAAMEVEEERLKLEAAEEDAARIQALQLAKGRMRFAPSRSGSGAEPPPHKKDFITEDISDTPPQPPPQFVAPSPTENAQEPNPILFALNVVTRKIDNMSRKSENVEKKMESIDTNICKMASKEDLTEIQQKYGFKNGSTKF